jgi:chitodextrinase
VSGNSLRAGASFDFETKSSYSVRVQVSDGALTYAEAFTITVTDVDDTAPTVPTDLASSNVTATSATISWSASSDNVGVIGYKVYNGTTLVGTTTVGVTPNATSLALSGLVSGSSNSITVVALDIAGNKSTASTALTVNLLDVVAPSVPSGFATFNVTQSGFTVSWTASTDNRAVRSYNVYRNGTYVATVGTNRYTFTGLTTSTTYNISVLAIDTSNNRSIQSAPFAVTTSTPPDVTAPSIPSGLTTTSVSSNRILLTWTPSTDNIGITGYNVYVNNVYVKTVTAAQTDLTGLTQLTTYSIEVQALDAAKNRSLRSTLLVVTTRDGLAPSVPSGLASGSITRNGFRVSWTAATDNVAVANYNVYRNGAYVATTGPTTTSYTFSNLPFNETHQVRIMAIDASGNKSAQSTALSVATTFVVDPIAPSAPTNVTSSNVTKTGLRVTWTAATDNVAVRNYNLYRNGAYVATVSGTTTGYNFSGLTAGTTYSIVVRAIDAEGNFTNSTAQSVTTLP